MKNVLVVINTLNGGGAEKVLLETVKALDKNKYKVQVLSIINQGIYIDEIKKYCDYNYIFPDLFKGKINRVYYSLLLRVLKILPAKLQVSLWIKGDYDTAIAYLEGAPTKLVSGIENTRKLAWVHVDPIEAPYSTKAYLSLKQEKIAYQSYHKVLCVSTDLVRSTKEKFALGDSVSFQMNVLDPSQVKVQADEFEVVRVKQDIGEGLDPVYKMITIGRLASQKNYQLLLDVCAGLLKEGVTNFSLDIIGEGLERGILEEKIVELGLSEYVQLLGFKKNPYPYIKSADLAVCSSRAEGFSTFITESLILEKPVVTTDCAGMNDLLGASQSGIICKNSYQELLEGLKKVLTKPDIYCELKENATVRSGFFDLNKQMEDLETILGE